MLSSFSKEQRNEKTIIDFIHDLEKKSSKRKPDLSKSGLKYKIKDNTWNIEVFEWIYYFAVNSLKWIWKITDTSFAVSCVKQVFQKSWTISETWRRKKNVCNALRCVGCPSAMNYICFTFTVTSTTFHIPRKCVYLLFKTKHKPFNNCQLQKCIIFFP